MELAIDTSTRYAGVAAAQEGETLVELAWRSERNHTVELAPAVEYVLKRVGAQPKDLTAIYIAVGPGNFSALRVGLGLAKGMAMALDVPLIGVGTLEIEGFPYLDTGYPVCPLLDAGRQEVAWALFQGVGEGQKCLLEEQVSPPEELCAQLSQGVLFCGEGVEKFAAQLQAHLPPGAVVMRQPLPTRRPGTLAWLGRQRLAAGERDNVAALQPRYLRGPSITTPRAPRRIK